MNPILEHILGYNMTLFTAGTTKTDERWATFRGISIPITPTHTVDLNLGSEGIIIVVTDKTLTLNKAHTVTGLKTIGQLILQSDCLEMH
jgi:hypothetical protein